MKQLEGYHCRRIPFLGLIGSVNFCLVLRESGLEEIIATYRQQVLVLNYILYKYSSYSFFPSLRKVFGFQYTDFKREFENIFVHAGLSHIYYQLRIQSNNFHEGTYVVLFQIKSSLYTEHKLEDFPQHIQIIDLRKNKFRDQNTSQT